MTQQIPEPRTGLLNCGAACAEVVVFVAIFTLLRCLVLLFPVFLLRRVVDVLVSVAASPATVPSPLPLPFLRYHGGSLDQKLKMKIEELGAPL